MFSGGGGSVVGNVCGLVFGLEGEGKVRRWGPVTAWRTRSMTVGVGSTVDVDGGAPKRE